MSIAPVLHVEDVDTTIAFYVALGFNSKGTLTGPDGRHVFGDASWGEHMIMLDGTHPVTEVDKNQRGRGVVFHIKLDDQDIDKLYHDAKTRGVEVVEEIVDKFWGERTFAVKDPDGYVLNFAKQVKSMSNEEMEAAMKAQAN